jgi:hypothetical protein
MPWRLAADWRGRWAKRDQEQPGALTLVVLRAIDVSHGLDDWSYLKRVRAQFREWHRTRALSGGFYGATVRREGDAWRAELLIAVSDADAAKLTAGRAFTAELLGSGLDGSDVIHAWQQEYLEEATAWETPGELDAFRALTKGRRKFQGFGERFADSESVQADDPREDEDVSEKPLHRMSGGSGKGTRRPPCCPRCGERLKRVGRFDPTRMQLIVAEDGVAEWRWRMDAQVDRHG